MSASFYWNSCEDLHTRYASEFPDTQAAVGAIRRVRTILEPHWKVQRFNEHPLAHILSAAPRPRELAHLAKKLELLQEIPGSGRVIPRLGSPKDFAAAWYEAHFALKLCVDGWKVEFVQQARDPRPDLLAEIDGHTFEVEVTSHNPPREDELSNIMASMLFTTQFQTRCVIGGVAYVSSRLNSAVLSRMQTRLLDAANRAKNEATCIWVNEPGLLNVQVASKEAAHLMDPQWKGTWRFERPVPLPKERRLDSIVREKVEKQLSTNKPGLLVIYDRLLTDEEERQLIQHDLSVQVGTYRQLKAVVLVRPLMWTDPFEPELQQDDMRVYGRHSLPDREGESFIIWRNMMEPKSADAVVSCITSFPSNLASFYADERSRDSQH